LNSVNLAFLAAINSVYEPKELKGACLVVEVLFWLISACFHIFFFFSGMLFSGIYTKKKRSLTNPNLPHHYHKTTCQ